MSAYEPLHKPGTVIPELASVDAEITVTDRILDETAGLNIHSDRDMLHAALALNTRLRALLAAVKAERGEQR
ncbi:hypothetical protein ACIF8T_21675 [Streptomyces sp. NPDC085946]|uniref:hypothetical protein n=1 Tax=Streptomyces sp. NPDC085946 TaxID=3365744 RepID=UPI0037CE80AE